MYDYGVRGLSEPIKLVLKYLRVPYQSLQPTEYAGTLHFPSFPLIRDNTTGFEMTHAVAICKYLAGKYRPKMLGSAMNEFAELDSILYLSCDVYKRVMREVSERLEKEKESAKDNCETPLEDRTNCKDEVDESKGENCVSLVSEAEAAQKSVNGKVREEVKDQEKVTRISDATILWISEKLTCIDKLLRRRNWLVGKQPSIADFFFIELINILDWVHPKNEVRKKYVGIMNFMRRFSLIPEMAGYKKSQENFCEEAVHLIAKEL